MYIYNVQRQKKDIRDLPLQLQTTALSLPRSIDLRPDCPPVFDQGQLGSCTANVGVAARMMLSDLTTMLSRLYLYYKERVIEGTVPEDAGASVRSICKALQRYGVCRTSLWPYVERKFDQPPPPGADANAVQYRIASYRSLGSEPAEILSMARRFLALKRQPVLIGVSIYESFESRQTQTTGVIPLPNPDTEQYLGGHALLVVGYDDAQQHFIVRNSWGTGWGDHGYGYMPYRFVLEEFAFDFWVLQ